MKALRWVICFPGPAEWHSNHLQNEPSCSLTKALGYTFPNFDPVALATAISKAHGYPPDKQEKATQTVLEQAEMLCADWKG